MTKQLRNKSILIAFAACLLMGACCSKQTPSQDVTMATDEDAALAFGEPVEDAVVEVLPQA